MKITIDTKTGEAKINGKLIKDASEHNKQLARTVLNNAICDNYPLSDYEEDCMWMSYRYCIGRHTIASHMHAGDIWKNCKGRMSNERALFTAYDINREIEMSLAFMKPYFHFPITSLNRIYTSAVDIVCQFMEDYNIKSIDDFIKYRDVHIILTDNERGYKFETVTWEEYLRPRVHEIMKKHFNNEAMPEDYAWKWFLDWRDKKEPTMSKDLCSSFEEITRDMPRADHYYFHDFEDLFVWNDLVHCFDYEHHHKSILVDNTECEWFWSWTINTEEREDGYHYRSFGYKKIRIPADKWNCNYSIYIPDSSIKKDIY